MFNCGGTPHAAASAYSAPAWCPARVAAPTSAQAPSFGPAGGPAPAAALGAPGSSDEIQAGIGEQPGGGDLDDHAGHVDQPRRGTVQPGHCVPGTAQPQQVTGTQHRMPGHWPRWPVPPWPDPAPGCPDRRTACRATKWRTAPAVPPPGPPPGRPGPQRARLGKHLRQGGHHRGAGIPGMTSSLSSLSVVDEVLRAQLRHAATEPGWRSSA